MTFKTTFSRSRQGQKSLRRKARSVSEKNLTRLRNALALSEQKGRSARMTEREEADKHEEEEVPRLQGLISNMKQIEEEVKRRRISQSENVKKKTSDKDQLSNG